MNYCIVGAGFSGAVIAREFAEAGLATLVVDERDHLAGNCHTERDIGSNVMVHKYGPHIFHTANDEVWEYISRFGEMMPYKNQVKTTVGGKVYSMPINLHTINQFFDKAMSPSEAKEFIASLGRSDIEEPANFEEQALKFVGEDIYKAFFHGYTLKQWGMSPTRLPASILKRLPLRFNYDDNYFAHPHQGIPKDGYTKIVENIFDHDLIKVKLGVSFEDLEQEFKHVFYCGPLDRYFGFELGRLGYRTLDFEEVRAEGDFQGTAVMNYGDPDVPYTRITEHKYFAPWEAGEMDKTIAFREYSRECGPDDIPYYPIRLTDEKEMLVEYVNKAETMAGVTFVGRLGTYSYLDMDVTIERALEVARAALKAINNADKIPTFVHRPI